MDRIATFLPEYRAVLETYLRHDDMMRREQALGDAEELSHRALEGGPSAEVMIELHLRTRTTLLEAWTQPGVSTEDQEALRRLRMGADVRLLTTMMQPHQLELIAHHERRWLREQAMLLALFQQTDDMIVIFDASGDIEDVNPAFVRLTGYSALEAATQSHVMWRPEPMPQRLDSGALATRHLRREQLRQDGSRFMAEWSICALAGRGAQPLGHVCIGRDVTRIQAMEDSLRENDKLRAIATLAGGIAHDFNNLLGSILGLAELCELEADKGSRLARNLGRIRQAGSKAAVLVRQMLDFSRQTPRSLQRTCVAELLENAGGLLRAALPPAITLRTRMLDDGELELDLVQMEQVLLNIAGNAAYAMRAHGGCVAITVDRADPGMAHDQDAPAGSPARHVRIRLADTGEGIPADALPKIFEPFYTTKPPGEGTGLGLAAVHGVVSAHGGCIDVHSLRGVGTTFSVFLPLAAAQVRAVAADDPVSAATAHPNPPHERARA